MWVWSPRPPCWLVRLLPALQDTSQYKKKVPLYMHFSIASWSQVSSRFIAVEPLGKRQLKTSPFVLLSEGKGSRREAVSYSNGLY